MIGVSSGTENGVIFELSSLIYLFTVTLIFLRLWFYEVFGCQPLIIFKNNIFFFLENKKKNIKQGNKKKFLAFLTSHGTLAKGAG